MVLLDGKGSVEQWSGTWAGQTAGGEVAGLPVAGRARWSQGDMILL